MRAVTVSFPRRATRNPTVTVRPLEAAAPAGVRLPASPTPTPDDHIAGSAPLRSGSADIQPVRPWAERYSWRLAVGDVIALAWAAFGTHLVHFGANSTRVSRDPDYLPFIALTVVLAVVWLLALHWSGSRDPEVVGQGPEEYKRVVRTSFGVFGLVAISSYIFDLHLPRAYVLVMLPAGLAAVLVGRFTWRRWLHLQRKSGRFMSMMLVVGNVRTVRELLTDLRRAPLAGYGVLGVSIHDNSPLADLTVDPITGRREVDGVRVLGGLDNVAATALEYGADTVAVTSTAAFGPAAVRRLSWELEKTDIALVLAPALTNIAGPRIHTKPIAGLPLIHVDKPTYRGRTVS